MRKKVEPIVLDYNKLKSPQLKKICEDRGIVCNPTIKDMVRSLKLDDENKFVYHTTQEKKKQGWWLIGIDYRNLPELIRMGQLVEKKQSQPINYYSVPRLYYRMEEEFVYLGKK